MSLGKTTSFEDRSFRSVFYSNEVYVYTAELLGARLRSPEDVMEVLRAVAGGTHSGSMWGPTFSSTPPIDACGIVVSAVGSKQDQKPPYPVRITVVYRVPGSQTAVAQEVEDLVSFGYTRTDKTSITENATRVLKVVWPDVVLRDATFGFIEQNQAATDWWLKQPTMWAAKADPVRPDLMGRPTQAFDQPTQEQVLVGDVESPQNAVPLGAEFRAQNVTPPGPEPTPPAPPSPPTPPAPPESPKDGLGTASVVLLGLASAVAGWTVWRWVKKDRK
jgi:hypothetical protein